jgi:hypothetical protein
MVLSSSSYVKIWTRFLLKQWFKIWQTLGVVCLYVNLSLSLCYCLFHCCYSSFLTNNCKPASSEIHISCSFSYDAWVIYNFLSLCLAWVGGPGAVVVSLSGRTLKPSWVLMTCCYPAIPLDGCVSVLGAY